MMAADSSPARHLWRDYEFLTNELAKFTAKQNWDMVLELLNQRTELQKQIEEQRDAEFTASLEGRSLLEGILAQERIIGQRIKLSRNQAQNRQKVVKAYDAFSTIPAGSLMNRGT